MPMKALTVLKIHARALWGRFRDEPLPLNPTLAARTHDPSTRSEQTEQKEDLEESILLKRKVLALHSPGHPDRPMSLGSLAVGLHSRYDQVGHIEDLEESIVLLREALTLLPPGHPDHTISLGSLSLGLGTRYDRLGQIEDLEESIVLGRNVLAVYLPGHPYRSTCLGNLSVDLSTRYKQVGKIEDLEESVSLNREALALRPPGHPDHSTSLNNLALGLRARHRQLGDIEDLEESVVLERKLLILRPPGHPLHSLSLGNIALCLGTRYDQLGEIKDLDESILLGREMLTLRRTSHPDHSKSLNNLATDLRIRYKQVGKVEDLEESILLNREALALCPPGHPDHSTSLNNLAIGLRARYQQLGQIEDLEEFIVLDRKALVLCPPGHPDHSVSVSNLAVGLCTRYNQLGQIEDLEESILLNREALALRPPGRPDHSMSLNNLAVSLSSRYRHFGQMKDLEESILLDRQALAARPPGHPDHSTSLSNLAVDLTIRYDQYRQLKDLEESIWLRRKALASCLPGHPNRSSSLHNLATALEVRYRECGEIDPDDAQEMCICYEQAALDSTSMIKDRLQAAITWAQVSRNYQKQSILTAYTTSLNLLNRALISRPDVEGLHTFIAMTDTSLASDAASAAIQAGKLELAVEFLEQGRDMLWSRIHAYKYPLEQLRQVEGGRELADQLETLSASLERLVLLSDRSATFDEKNPTSILSLDARINQHRVLSEQWEVLVGRIREMPDFTHFLKAPPFHTLQSAAAEGPIILINVSNYRSDAIILTIDNPPILIPLPDIEPIGLRKLGHQLRQPTTTNRDVISVLRHLWESIVSLVVTCLDELGFKRGSRIWWCPTAELGALPLHAAGPYRAREKNLQDIYVSSYTSTLSSLIRARSNIVQLTDVPKLLVVGQPNETLQKVEEEVENIKQYGGIVDLLLGAQASHSAVLDGLKQHPWVHFACHGHLGNEAKPFQASFELYDNRRLTLLELIQARLPNAESAFLAACHSAEGDYRTPDENLHLSAALQFCGFRSVVGTLWEMFDEQGPMISNEFYKYMFRNPGRVDFRDAAQALNLAIRKMSKTKLPVERWVMFVHIGA